MAEDIINEHIRTYTFNVPGFIPGVPGVWSAGSWVQVNEETKEVLDWGPKPTPAPEEPVQESKPDKVPEQQGTAQPSSAQQLLDVVKQL